jgi:hypothetical protein
MGGGVLQVDAFTKYAESAVQLWWHLLVGLMKPPRQYPWNQLCSLGNMGKHASAACYSMTASMAFPALGVPMLLCCSSTWLHWPTRVTHQS